jgi:hypothetical protein
MTALTAMRAGSALAQHHGLDLSLDLGLDVFRFLVLLPGWLPFCGVLPDRPLEGG